MTYDEAIKYTLDIGFCNGCPVDMATVDLNDIPCNRCEHRLFFAMARSAFLALKQIAELEPLSAFWDDGDYATGYMDCLRNIESLLPKEQNNDD